MSNTEVINFINAITKNSYFSYANTLSDTEKDKIGVSCNGIPLAIKWLLSKSKSTQELLMMAEQLEKSGLFGDELLEFSFRRVFDSLTKEEKEILKVLAIVPSISTEAILKGSNQNSDVLFESL